MMFRRKIARSEQKRANPYKTTTKPKKWLVPHSTAEIRALDGQGKPLPRKQNPRDN